MGKKSPSVSSCTSPTSSPTKESVNLNANNDNSVTGVKKKKSIIPKLFGSKKSGRTSEEDGRDSEVDKKVDARRKAFLDGTYPFLRQSFSERVQASKNIEGLDLCNFDPSITIATELQDYRVFVATWNVSGRSPTNELNLDDFLHVEGSSDIYIIGFQEIVPLNAGNVLVVEDNEPAARWLSLINLALNSQHFGSTNPMFESCPINSKTTKDSKSNNLFQKPNLKQLTKALRVDSSLVKPCNCYLDSLITERPGPGRLRENPYKNEYNSSPISEYFSIVQDAGASPSHLGQTNYRLISSKKMVGVFLSVWARKELVPYIGHLRVSSMGTGIMGCLRNKGCISVSMTLHKTSFCFVCSHLASGEKEGDELKRNTDVADILKGTQFPKVCKKSERRVAEKIIDHEYACIHLIIVTIGSHLLLSFTHHHSISLTSLLDCSRILWFGDLNYRVTLPYEITKVLVDDNNWDILLEKDQLNIERESGRVFKGWKEGQIQFPPTYKYTQNSDLYAGENVKSKKKRRTPAWCDRILWHGEGIEELLYIRGESRFSDHRPVCAVFSIDVEVRRNFCTRLRKGFSYTGSRSRLSYEDYMPQRHSFYEI